MNKKISFPVAIIIIVVCAVLTGLVLIWQYKLIPEIEIPPFTPSEKPPEDETANWKTYRNDEYGFEFKYPSTYLLKDQLAEEEKAILLGDKEFPKPDIAPWYHAPISIGPTKHENLTAMINSLADKTTSTIEISGVKADVIEGKYASYPGLPNIYRMKIIMIPEKDLTIIVKELYAGETSDWNEILTTTTKIISTFRFLDWQFFSIKEYGFSMEIHPDYKKTREEEIERERFKMKLIVFSKDSDKVGITIDKEPNDVKIMRSALLGAFKFGPEEWQRNLEYYSDLGLVEPGAEFISKENIKRGACMGIQLLEKKGTKYERNLILTSLNLEDMFVTIWFEYYTKDTEAEILKMIETIECTK